MFDKHTKNKAFGREHLLNANLFENKCGKDFDSVLGGGKAPIHDVSVPVRVAALIGGKEQHQLRNFLWIAIALERHLCQKALFDLVAGTGSRHLFNGTHHAGFNWTGINRIDTNPGATEFQCGAAHQANYGVLARHIC
jgi:hypothetical protein